MSAPQFNDHERHLRAIIDAGLRAADPRAATARALRVNPPRDERFAVIAVGKAGASMWSGLSDVVTQWCEAVMLVPEGVAAPAWALVGDHPIPTQRNVSGALAIRRFVMSIATGDAGYSGFVLLLSGGASALMTLPAQGISLGDYAAATRGLLGCGRVTIDVLNCIRKHCEQLKGGRLAELMHPLWCDAYVLSDVVGDDLSVIGSGPVAPDPTTYGDALAYASDEAESCLPESVLRHLQEPRESETPKPGDPVFDRVRHFMVANNETAVRGAAAKAAELGFRVAEPELLVQGDAAEVGRRLVARAMAGTADQRPMCLMLGGETTVDVGAARGRGGRNQEMALAAAIALDGVAGIALATLATDGVDGPTDAAGAIVTGETCRRAQEPGLEPVEFLRQHDSYGFFERVGGHTKTGPTGTNVNDVAIALVYPD